MRHLIALCLVFLSIVISTAQINFKIPNLIVHDSLGVKTNIATLSFEEGHNATLYYYWAAWCSPCTAKIELLRPYAEDWLENYNVNIKLIVYDRQILSDSITSISHYKTNDWNEIGDLYFAHKDDVDQAFDRANFAVSPFALSFLHRRFDRKLLIFSGASAEQYDQTIKEFFDPIVTSTNQQIKAETKIFQDENYIRLELSDFENDEFISVFNSNGQLIERQIININISEYEFSKSNYTLNQIYFLKVGNSNSAIPVYVY